MFRSLFSRVAQRQPSGEDSEPILRESTSRIREPSGKFSRCYRIFCKYLWLLPWAFSIGVFLFFYLTRDSVDVLTWVSFPHVRHLPLPSGLSADFHIEAELNERNMGCGMEEMGESLISKLESSHLVLESPGFYGPVEDDEDPKYRQGIRVVALPDFDYILVPKNTNQAILHRGGVSFFPRGWIYDFALYSCGTVFYPMQCGNIGSTPTTVFDTSSFSQVPVTISDPIVFIAQLWGDGYYHFFMDLTRLALVHEYLLAREHVKILSFSIDRANTNALFSLIGINPSRVIHYSRSKLYHANSSVIVPPGTSCFRSQSQALEKMKAIMKANLLKEFPNDPKYDIVLQKRGTSNGRYFSNHDELEAALKKAFPQYSVGVAHEADSITTARMHMNAKLLIGPHGAGAVNIIFAEDGASLIEVHPNVSIGFVNGRHRRMRSSEWTTHQLHGRVVEIIAKDGSHFAGSITAPVDEIIRHAREFMWSTSSDIVLDSGR